MSSKETIFDWSIAAEKKEPQENEPKQAYEINIGLIKLVEKREFFRRS